MADISLWLVQYPDIALWLGKYYAVIGESAQMPSRT